jgi:phosphatidate cytidylyltransferase
MSSLVLVPVAIAASYFGGLVFLAFWAVAALGVLWEWGTLVCEHDRDPVLTIGAIALVGAGLLLAFDWSGIALALIAFGVCVALHVWHRRGAAYGAPPDWSTLPPF